MELFFWIVIGIVSAVVLVKAAGYFTDYSARLGVLIGISSFIVGVTIVSIGTSLPELITSLIAVLREEPVTEFVASNVVGSNIANSLLVIGIAAIAVKTLKVEKQLIDVDLPFLFISTGLFILFLLDLTFTWQEAVISLVLFVLFILYSIKQRSAAGSEAHDVDKAVGEKRKGGRKDKAREVFMMFVGIIVSAGFIFVGAKYFVDAILTVSDLLGISSTLLTLSAVALGTSLPEVVTSVIAARRGEHGIAIGNAFGSNTFNALLVMGVPGLFGNLTIAPEVFAIGVPFLVVATLAAIFTTFDNKVRNWEGYALLVVYAAFLGKLFGII